jgi:hypothetical protein
MTSSDLHGAKEPTRRMMRCHQGTEIGWRWIKAFAMEKKSLFHQGHFGRAGPRGIDPLAVECWLQMTQDITIRLMKSS